LRWLRPWVMRHKWAAVVSITSAAIGMAAFAFIPVLQRAVIDNVIIAGDLVRRFLLCRMDAGVERPESRRFRFDPIELLKRDREHYVKAVLNITRAYLESGNRVDVAPFGSFETWSRMVREPLIWAGWPDPVRSIELAAELDPDRQHLEAMVAAVHSIVGLKPFDVASLVGLAKSDLTDEPHDLHERRHALRRAIEDVALRGPEISSRALGRWLAAFEGRVASGLRFMRAREEKGRAGLTWRLQAAEPAAA